MTHPVDVWTVSLEILRPSILSPDEQARAARFIFDRDREKWARARTILRTILAQYARTGPADLVFSYGEHGKPALRDYPGIGFNMSHAGDYAMVAVTREAQVGIDLEFMRPNLNLADLLRRIGETNLPETREELYQVWTGREARTKALGAPLMRVPTGDLRLVKVEAPEGYAAAMAMVGREPDVHYRGSV